MHASMLQASPLFLPCLRAHCVRMRLLTGSSWPRCGSYGASVVVNDLGGSAFGGGSSTRVHAVRERERERLCACMYMSTCLHMLSVPSCMPGTLCACYRRTHPGLSARAHACVYVCMSVCPCTCVCVRLCVWLPVHMRVSMPPCMVASTWAFSLCVFVHRRPIRSWRKFVRVAAAQSPTTTRSKMASALLRRLSSPMGASTFSSTMQGKTSTDRGCAIRERERERERERDRPEYVRMTVCVVPSYRWSGRPCRIRW
jgi:hypothetical protein